MSRRADLSVVRRALESLRGQMGHAREGDRALEALARIEAAVRLAKEATIEAPGFTDVHSASARVLGERR